MAVTIIDSRNRAAFENLISRRVFRMLGDPQILALGSVDGEGLASGALVCRLDADNVMELVWLFIAESRRGQGMASELLDSLFAAMDACNMPDLYGLIPVNGQTEELRRFLELKEFSFEPVTDDLVSMPVESLLTRLRMFEKVPFEATPLDQIPRRYVNRVLGQKNAKGAALLGRSGLTACCPCSCGVMRDGELEGLMLFLPREEGDGVALVVAEAADSVMMSKMLYHSLRKMQKTMPAGAMLTIATLNGLGVGMSKLQGVEATVHPVVCVSYAL